MNYWLLKTEPSTYSIADLAAEPDRTTFWDGVRNYQARNFLRSMKRGDRVLLYHSNADPPAVVGTAVVVGEARPDPTAWDKRSKYYDAKSTRDQPRWFGVDVKLDETFPQPIARHELAGRRALAGMELLRQGSRLSVQPVQKKQFEAILRIARAHDSA